MSARRPLGATWTARHWPAIRARGMRRFVLVRGLLTWGGVMFVFMAAMMWFKFGFQNPTFGLLIGMAALMCAIGGLAWGAVTWVLNERIYRSLPSSKELK